MTRFRLSLAAICLLDLLANLPFLGRTTVAQIDEARISEVAREMAVTGDWLVPRIGGRAFASYPPLGYWLIALSGTVFGFTEWAVRLPSVLAGVALLAVVGATARRLAGERAGLFAAAILATTPTFYFLQSSARGDVVVTLFAALAFDRFLAVADGERPGVNRLLFYLAIAAGFLTKGPLSIVIPGLGIAGWLALHRRWRVLLDLQPWWGVPLVAALVAPWFVAIHRHPECGYDFLKVNLLLENVNAFTHGFEQKKPVWFYAERGLPRLLPWLFAFLYIWPVRRTRGLAVALAWAALVFAFLHVSSSKRVSYLTYFSPAFAIATGILVAAVEEKPVRRTLFGLAIGGVATGAVVPILPIRWDPGFPVADLVVPMAIGIGLGSVALGLLTWKRGPDAGLAGLCALLLAGVAVHLQVFGPRMDEEGRRWRDFARRVNRAVPLETPIAAPEPTVIEPCLFFYLRRIPPDRSDSGLVLALERHRERYAREGRLVEVVDVVLDDRRRPTYLLRIRS